MLKELEIEHFKKILKEGIELLKRGSVKPTVSSLKEVEDPTAAAITMPPSVPSPQMPPSPVPGAPIVPTITVDTIITKLNMVRRGKSFNDSPMYEQLTAMFNALSEEDKANLDRLLSQIGQVVVNNLPGGTPPVVQQPSTTPIPPPPPVT